MRARHVLRWAGASSVGLALGGCIERKLECPSPGPAATAASAPASAVVGTGVSLVGAGGLQAFALQGDTEKVTLTTVPVTGQTFREALRARITRGSGREWAVQLRAPTAGPVAEGDVLLATFYLRADEPLEDAAAGQTQFVFEQARDPYTKSVTYDVEAGRDWREVHVPFVAKQTFAPGEAQIVFRLGYDPETIEIGGVIVEDFGKKRTVATLPRTRPWSPPKEKIAALPPIDGGALAVEVAPSKVVGPISPYVYGVNSQAAGGVGVTVRRMGGNRQTAYNWEINASNAGTDYENSSDDWPCTVLGYGDCDEPAGQVLDFYAENERLGVETVATIPMVDYVAADKKGQVSEAEKAPSPRWDRSIARKNGPYAASPDTTDRAVYEDELVEYLVRKLGKASRGGIRFYSLDNEPGLWPQTHPRVHPEKTTYREVVTRTEAIASQITAIDPSALVLGGVMYGWSEYQTLHDAPDAKDYDAQYGTYVDYFLSRMKDLEKTYGRRLVHVLDVHWYPEARGTERVTEDDLSPKTVRARVEAPRALWDPTYREKSWIQDQLGDEPIRLVPWIKEKIAKDYPGTKLSISEYDFGAGESVSGGIAQADALGVFGREGVYLADYWGSGAGNGPLPSYVAAAFRLYRNYDGKGGAFGDTAVAASVPDPAKASVYAATDSKHPRRLTVLVLDKDERAAYTAHVTIDGSVKYALREVYRLDGTAPRVQPAGGAPATHDNQLDYPVAPLSATLLVYEQP